MNPLCKKYDILKIENIQHYSFFVDFVTSDTTKDTASLHNQQSVYIFALLFRDFANVSILLQLKHLL